MVAKEEVPTTVSVPLAVREEVAVMDPPVIFPEANVEMLAEIALRRLVKKLVDVAFVVLKVAILPEALVRLVLVRLVATALVVVELPTIRLVMLAKVARMLEKNPLVEVALVIVLLVP